MRKNEEVKKEKDLETRKGALEVNLEGYSKNTRQNRMEHRKPTKIKKSKR